MKRALGIAFVVAACGKAEPPRTVHGWIVEGSLTREIVDQRSQLDFTLEEKGVQVHVRTHGPPPDNLKDRAEVSATCADRKADLCDATDYRVIPPQLP